MSESITDIFIRNRNDPAKAAEELMKNEFSDDRSQRENFRAVALKEFSPKQLSSFISQLSVELSKKMMKGSIGREKLIAQASNALDETVKISNTMLMRLSEWFSLHYPELRISNEEMSEKIVQYGKRDNWPGFKSSLGVDLTEEDENILKSFAESASKANELKNSLESYIKTSMREITPNFSSLLEPMLGARMLAAAGSLEKLARMSASNIQIIGAEKALFRHLKKKGKAPKYGMIYMSTVVQSVPEDKRGKVARAYAAKLMMAARIDFFSGRDETDKLKRELKEDLEKV